MRDRSAALADQGSPLTRANDSHVSRVIAVPSLGSRFITEAAADLTNDKNAAGQPLTPLAWDDALRRAHHTVLNDRPEIVANAVYATFTEHLPDPRLGETKGEYALRLHTMARGL